MTGTSGASPRRLVRWTQIRTAIGPITQALWGDVPAEDLATAGRVLGIVLDRANAVLAGP